MLLDYNSIDSYDSVCESCYDTQMKCALTSEIKIGLCIDETAKSTILQLLFHTLF